MENNLMDVVYVLGNGSKWDDTEIRFSLRSIEKNLTNYRNVIIVGQCPPFLKNVIHIPANDIFDPGINADGNIITKVLAACNYPGISDNFLFINDDHLILNPVDISDIPPFHKGDMSAFPNNYWEFNYWRKRLKHTKDILQSKNLPCLHFDCHTPIIFNKYRFPRIMNQFNYKSGIGYTMKSLYGNIEYPEGPELQGRKKTIFRHYSSADLKNRLASCAFMSFNDQGLNKNLKKWLISNFPSRSNFEKDAPSDLVFSLYFWEIQGKPYDSGVEIFEKYFKHRNLTALFKSGYSPGLHKKLNYKLQRLLNDE